MKILAIIFFSFSLCAQAQILKIKDISYGPHVRNKLDFYRLKNNKKLPIVVLIHGGVFTTGDKSFYENHNLTNLLVKNGFGVIALNYPF